MTDRAVALAAPVTRQFEGLRLKAYLCPAGIPTIGYGHTRGVRLGMVCTMAQATAWLEEDLLAAAKAVRRLVKVPLTAGQEAALVDFVFNLGEAALASSTLLRCINNRQFDLVPAQLRRWNKAKVNGVYTVLRGLVDRREAEVRLWLS